MLDDYENDHNTEIKTINNFNAKITAKYIDRIKEKDIYTNKCKKIMDLLEKRHAKDLSVLSKDTLVKVIAVYPCKRTMGKTEKDSYKLISSKDEVLWASLNMIAYLDKVIHSLKNGSK
jgi:hypothetical protein